MWTRVKTAVTQNPQRKPPLHQGCSISPTPSAIPSRAILSAQWITS